MMASSLLLSWVVAAVFVGGVGVFACCWFLSPFDGVPFFEMLRGCHSDRCSPDPLTVVPFRFSCRFVSWVRGSCFDVVAVDVIRARRAALVGGRGRIGENGEIKAMPFHDLADVGCSLFVKVSVRFFTPPPPPLRLFLSLFSGQRVCASLVGTARGLFGFVLLPSPRHPLLSFASVSRSKPVRPLHSLNLLVNRASGPASPPGTGCSAG